MRRCEREARKAISTDLRRVPIDVRAKQLADRFGGIVFVALVGVLTRDAGPLERASSTALRTDDCHIAAGSSASESSTQQLLHKSSVERIVDETPGSEHGARDEREAKCDALLTSQRSAQKKMQGRRTATTSTIRTR